MNGSDRGITEVLAWHLHVDGWRKIVQTSFKIVDVTAEI
jgi:hypothetical protein